MKFVSDVEHHSCYARPPATAMTGCSSKQVHTEVGLGQVI